jgi:hypothetical protein
MLRPSAQVVVNVRIVPDQGKRVADCEQKWHYSFDALLLIGFI